MAYLKEANIHFPWGLGKLLSTALPKQKKKKKKANQFLSMFLESQSNIIYPWYTAQCNYNAVYVGVTQ